MNITHVAKLQFALSLWFRRLAVLSSCFSILCLLSDEAEIGSKKIQFFETKIRPVLVDACFKCHSKEKNKSKGGLLVDSRNALLNGGENGPAIEPGNAAASLLFTAIQYGDENLQMPPDDPLTPEQIKDFEIWINEGAHFPEGALPSSSNKKPWWDRIPPESLLPLEISPQAAIDKYILDALRIKNILPAPSATESAWLRRITLDLAGRPPTPAERNHFLFNPFTDRKEGYVDYLKQTDCYKEQQIEEFNWLLMDGKGSDFKSYLETAFTESKRWDEIFKEIILADYANESAKGAPAFIKERVRDIDRLTNDVSVRFFGVNISCAQCHDHPNVADWTQARYYGMKSFFSRTFENGGFIAEREYGQVSYKNTDGDTLKASLQFLEGDVLTEKVTTWTDEKRKDEKARLEALKKEKKPVPPPSNSRRARLVESGLSEGQVDYFARAIVNRIWYRLMGAGLVEPLDQLHGDNDPSHPELLQWLSRWFIKNDYDLNGLIRGIVLSQAYQRSSAWEGGERPAENLYAVANIRVMTPRQYAATLLIGATSTEEWNMVEPDSTLHAEKLKKALGKLDKIKKWFDRPAEDFYFSVDEALQLSNDEEVQKLLFNSENSGIITELSKQSDVQQSIRATYQHLYHRPPSTQELETLESFLNTEKDLLAKQFKSMVWALLTSPESRLNH